jgi:ribonucleoside-diphosphate reductase alpha chain
MKQLSLLKVNMQMSTKYKELSRERKELQSKGLVPEWYITPGFQMFKSRYEYQTEGRSVRGQFERIAKTASKHLASIGKEQEGYDKFFEMLWKGWLSPSTPVLANMGTSRGMPVSCTANVVHDSIDGFYSALRECAILSKLGFGCASYLGDIRPRGSKIADGNVASGVLPVLKDFVTMTRNVSQGGVRRGAWAGYLPIEHGDFDEIIDYVSAEPEDVNLGWCVSDEFITKLNNREEEAIRRFGRVMKLKMITGRGYFFFTDKVNRHVPEMYKKHGLTVKCSQLCQEVTLFSDYEHSYSCVLSSMNLATYDEWKDTDAVFWATVFLDCVVEEFLTKARTVSGLEKVVRCTEKGRALGLGVCGLHTYMQDHNIIFESLDAQFKMCEMFELMQKESKRASQWLAQELGEPEWCVGFGVRNTHTLTCPPTKSTSLLMAGVSEGVSPNPSSTYTQQTASGEIDRINGSLVAVMKAKGVFNYKEIDKIIDDNGSVQNVSWLDDHEKAVFRTAFEMKQNTLLRYAAIRNKYVDQWQSINLFIPADTPEEVIAELHEDAFNNEQIEGLYYLVTKSGYSHQGKLNTESCEACQ